MLETIIAQLNELSPDRRAALLVLLKQRGIDLAKQWPITQVAREGLLPLSYGQERLWFLAQWAPDSTAYHIADAVVIDGTLELSALQASIDLVVARHESLRTTFHAQDGIAKQCIHKTMTVPIAWQTVVNQPDALSCAKHLVAAHENLTFDLSIGPLFRVLVIQLQAERSVLSLVTHHLISDEWSLSLLVNEFAEAYAALQRGQTPAWPALPVAYADFAVWQRQYLTLTQELDRQLAFWQNHLAGGQREVELPYDKPKSKEPSDAGAAFQFSIKSEIALALRRLCHEQQATLFMAMLTLFALLLYRYSGQASIRIGIPVANRSRPELAGVVGFFVNTQVWQIQLHGGMSFVEVLTFVREHALAAQTNAELPFEQLVDALQPERQPGVNPLFQVMFNHQYRVEPAELTGVKLTPLQREERTTQFELILDSVETQDSQLQATLTYAADMFSTAAITRMAEHLCQLAEAAVTKPDQAVRELSLLTEQELNTFIATPVTPKPYRNIVETIFSQAKQTPNNIAVHVNDEVISYAELVDWSLTIADELAGLGLKPGSVVALCLPRGAVMIAAQLAVLIQGAVL
ncbi:condensation domain-containing protein, partial [Methylocucumis oryzae]